VAHSDNSTLNDLAYRSLDSFMGLDDGTEGIASQTIAKLPLWQRARALVPGIIIAATVAMAASWLSEHYQAPVMLFALLLGMAVNFTSADMRCRPGLDFSGRTILRLGVALLGMRITLGQIQSLGSDALLLTAAGVTLTIIFGWLLSRAFRLSPAFGVLTGGAVAICGASAALAISAVLPKGPAHERDTILTVVGVTTLSTIAMVLYPILATALKFDPATAGTFLGATIHDVAQVVGAGYSLSQQSGDTATIVKLFRVALLLPAVLVISYIFRNAAHTTGKRPPLLPAFLVGFAALVLLNSFVTVPKEISEAVQTFSRWCLVIAISALGTKTALGDLVKVGWRPVALIVGETLFIGTGVLIGLLLLR
jgi:uncharacterized integral membrane protein (TIGR00698 family)